MTRLAENLCNFDHACPVVCGGTDVLCVEERILSHGQLGIKDATTVKLGRSTHGIVHDFRRGGVLLPSFF